MARLTIGQQCARLLTFLMGLRHPEVAQILAQYGFDQEALDEGWILLRQAAGGRLEMGATPTVAPTGIVARIDAWENLWFPITGAVLRRHHPDIHEHVFFNLPQTSGPEVVLSVSTLLERLDALAEDEDGAAALETLAKHGLTEQALDEARGMLELATSVREEAEGAIDPETQAEQEQAMWDYYLQWSTIARSVIKNRRLLRNLGFLRTRPTPGDEPSGDELDLEAPVDDDDDVIDAPGEEDAAPVLAAGNGALPHDHARA